MPHHHHHGGFGHIGGHHHHHQHGFGHLPFGHHHHHHQSPLGAIAAGAVVVGAVAAASVAAQPRYGAGPGYGQGYGQGYGMAVVAPAPPPVMIYATPPAPVVISAPVPQPAVPLGVASVSLPSFAIVKHADGATYFVVQVRSESGAEWSVKRRYNQFNDLADRLGDKSRNILCAPFPRKHLTGCEGSKLEQRRQALETWILQVLRYSDSYDHAHWRPALRAFLEVPMMGAATAAVPVATPVMSWGTQAPAASAPIGPTFMSTQALAAAPVIVSTPMAASSSPSKPSPLASAGPAFFPLPPPSEAPPSATSGTERPAGGSAGSAMEVEVPAGVVAGQHLSVTVPSGEQVLVQIPEGVVAGQSLSLWYEGGVLQPMV